MIKARANITPIGVSGQSAFLRDPREGGEPRWIFIFGRAVSAPDQRGGRGARIGADTSPLKDFRKGRVDSLAGMWVDEGTGWDRQSKWLNDASWPTERD